MVNKVDKNLLRYCMGQKGYTVARLSEEIKINKVSIYNKMNGKIPFMPSDIGRIRDVLGLTDTQVCDIFIPRGSE